MRLKEAPELGDEDAAMAFAMAAAMTKLLAGEKREVCGVALGIALGNWVAPYGGLAIQEQALNRVLRVAAVAAQTAGENASDR
jgi:hypothetical protein